MRTPNDDEAPYFTDTTRWPVVVWRMRRVLTEPEFAVYLHEAQQVLDKRQRFAQVIVSQLGEGKSALTQATRQTQAAWVKKNFDLLQLHCAAMAVVLTDMSAVAHFTVSTLMSFLGRAPAPSRIFTKEEEAFAWALSLVEAPVSVHRSR
jgi:hypothetical protein